MSEKQFKKIKAAIEPLKDEFDAPVEKVNELYTEFDEIDFEPDEENSDIEEKIGKLEEAIDALDDDDAEMKEKLETKIGSLREASGSVSEAENLINEIGDLFSEIRSAAENLNF